MREQADPDRSRGEELRSVEIERLGERLPHAVRDHLDRRARLALDGVLVAVEVAQQQEELVAALARHQIGVARARAQAVGELGKQQVP